MRAWLGSAITNQRTGSTRAATLASALAATVLWGTQGPVAKVVVTETNIPLLALYRGLAAAVLLLAVLGWRQGWKAFVLPRHDLLRVLAVGVIGLGICQLSWLYALDRVPASVTVILTNTSPLYIAILAVLWLGEPMRRTTVIGLAVSCVGVTILVLRGGGPAESLDLGGAIAGLLSGVAWAIYTVVGRDLMARYDPVRIVALTALVGVLTLAPVAILVPPILRPGELPTLLGGALFLGAVPVAVGYVLWYNALRRLRAVQIAAFQYMVPVWTVAIAYVWLGEPLTLALFAGMALVIAGVWLVQRH